MVQPHLSDEENQRLNSIKRENQALVYGKRAEFWQVTIVLAPKNVLFLSGNTEFEKD